MRKDKYKPEEKRLCNSQEQLIINHTNQCHICKTSFKEYKTFGVSHTPPCKAFTEKLRNHVDNCSTCNGAEKKWNEDAISITPEMRQITGDLIKGKIPDVGLLKKVSSYLFGELQMTSDEIHDMSAKAENEVKKSLEEEK
jgi:hypothetical protein